MGEPAGRQERSRFGRADVEPMPRAVQLGPGKAEDFVWAAEFEGGQGRDRYRIHVAALRALENGAPCRVLNCSSGLGASVREILAAVRAGAGDGFEIRDGPRGEGDPAVLVADTARLRSALHWSPRHGGLHGQAAPVDA